MLKKAGIVVAITATTFLSLSPLAFAGGHDVDHGTKQVNEGDEHYALVDASDNKLIVPVNVCNNHVPVTGVGGQVPFNDNDVTAPIQGALGLFSTIEQEEEFGVHNENACESDNSAGDTQVNSQD